MLQNASGMGRISLADEPPFRLGALWVEPGFRQVTGPQGQRTLEPRVMQVLVALVQARRGIVSRDALIARCWDGRIVGEAAINRVVSALRHLGSETGAFQIETITRVGYRLKADDDGIVAEDTRRDVIPASGAPRRIGRRALLAAIGLGATAAGAGLWWQGRKPSVPEEAVRLTQHALDRFRDSIEEDPQVLADLREAVRIAPDYAEAWGGLALVYAGQSDVVPGPLQPELAARARAAARRALALDPHDARAMIALLTLTPMFGNWAEFEARCRGFVRRTGRHPMVLGSLATLLQSVGRWRDSAPLFAEVNRKLLTNPIGHARHVQALWASGQAEAADHAMAEVLRRFPKHPLVWQTYVKMLMFGGRPGAAIAAAQDRESRPAAQDTEGLDALIIAARALESGSRADAAAAIRFNLETLPSTRDAFPVAYRCASLGDLDSAFAIIDGYYFGRGPWGMLAPRRERGEGEPWTSSLFQPPLAAAWRDPRFAALTRRLGLQDYWQRTQSRPDYLDWL